jgi:HEAT repeat protein
MSNQENAPKPMQAWCWIVGGIVAILIFAGLTAPMVMRAHVDPLSSEWGTLQTMVYGLGDYAASNDGRFPAHLDDLDSHPFPKFRDFRNGKRYDWVYFPGFTWNDRGDTILVAAPVAFSKADGTFRAEDEPSRIILTVDGRSLILEEKKYHEFVAEQSTAAWRNPVPVNSQDPWRFLDDPTWQQAPPPQDSAEPAPNIPDLISRLESGDDTERRNPADDLGEIDDPPPEVASALIKALGDSRAGYLAAMGLARISIDDASVIAPIIETLRTGNGQAEYWAAVALRQIGLDRARDAVPLMTALLARNGDDIQVTAAKALGGLGPDAAVAVPALIAVLAAGDSWAVKCAVITLGRIGPQAHAAIPILKQMFDSGSDYRMDVARALWSIDPTIAPHLLPFLIDQVTSQRNTNGPNQPMGHSFFMAIELLGEMGPAAHSAIPALNDQLRGGARSDAAWSLWRIDPTLLDPMTEIIATALQSGNSRDDRFAKIPESTARYIYHYTALEAVGMLWQMHPDRRDALRPVLVHVLRVWHPKQGLDNFKGSARRAIPAIEEYLQNPDSDPLRKFASEALQDIRTTDHGEW